MLESNDFASSGTFGLDFLGTFGRCSRQVREDEFFEVLEGQNLVRGEVLVDGVAVVEDLGLANLAGMHHR